MAKTSCIHGNVGRHVAPLGRETRKLTTFYKIHNKLCPPYLFNCLPPVTSDVNSYNLRNNQNYVPPRCRLRTSASSFIPSTVSLWNNLDISIRNSPTLSSLKNRVKAHIYKTPKYYSEDPRKLSILHTRLRHQCSSLNADLSKIHIINNFNVIAVLLLKMLYIIFWNVPYT